MKINWLDIDKVSGKKGTHEVSLTADAYEGTRTMDLLVRNATKQKVVDVSQRIGGEGGNFFVKSVGEEEAFIYFVNYDTWHNPYTPYILFYKYESDNEWTPWGEGIEEKIVLRDNEKLFIKGENTSDEPHRFGYSFRMQGVNGKTKGEVECGGDILSLLGENVSELTGDNTFNSLFEDCRILINPPSLPMTKLTPGCYTYMFNNCLSLRYAPELPATTLTDNCYEGMFYECTKLAEAPQLPATTLTDNCYEHMFAGCKSFTEAPQLPATSLAKSCYEYMFAYCDNLAEAPELPARELQPWCYYRMFYGCDSLTESPELPATTLADYCYYRMFEECVNLVNAPEILPATTLADICYNEMFRGCKSLIKAPELPATALAKECYEGMFGYCKSLIKAPVLPALILTERCYAFMFQGCEKINYIKCLASNSLGKEFSENWVDGVAPTGTFVKAEEVIHPINSVDGIPIGWTVIEETVERIMTFTPERLEFDEEGGTQEVIVYANFNWDITNIPIGLSVNQNSGTAGITHLYVTASLSEIERTIEIEFNDGFYLPIHQKKTIPQTDLSVSPNVLTIGYTGGLDNIAYFDISSTTNWVITTEDGWFSIGGSGDEHPERGSGNARRSLICEENTGDSQREGYLTISTESGDASVTLTIIQEAKEPEPITSEPFYFKTNGTSSNLTWKRTYPPYKLKYSFDNITWKTLQPDVIVWFTDKIYLKGNNDEIGNYGRTPTFSLAGDYVSVGGNLLSLLSEDGVKTELADNCFENLLYNNSALVDAKDLIMPSTTSESCFYQMFCKCINLVNPPEILPATALAKDCYRGMFYECESLIKTPLLPATTLTEGCYAFMFAYCTNLTEAAELPATTLVKDCYYYMFLECGSLNDIKVHSTTPLESTYSYGWVQRVASTGTFTKVSGIDHVEGWNGIPSGWTVVEF